MRSMNPIPGNPWPHDMVLSIDTPHMLTQLLFIRSVWQLEIADVPALDSEPDPGKSARPADFDPAKVTDLWMREWQRGWAQYESLTTGISTPDAATQHLLDTSTDAELWAAFSPIPPDVWGEGIDWDANGRWDGSLPPDHTVPLAQTPERVCLPELIHAWKSGVTAIIELPYAGYFADRITRRHPVVSAVTRRTPALYRRALEAASQQTDR
ncbi:hypothetical protein [Glaciihabitans sp. UYNi722]|uniref:hypothetical protein n=1 Tax=Glaciihabitans sp. UYNi722 TaxID=3156344 RepID=UPI0033963858